MADSRYSMVRITDRLQPVRDEPLVWGGFQLLGSVEGVSLAALAEVDTGPNQAACRQDEKYEYQRLKIWVMRRLFKEAVGNGV